MSVGYTGNNDIKFYPNITTENTCFSFTNKTNNTNEVMLFNNWWQEQVNLYGQRVNYYINNTVTLSADMLYGEQPTQVYSPPLVITIAVNLNENALMLSKYGLLSDDEVTAFIPITSFEATFGLSAEPKSGDVFEMYEYGSDRPHGRGGNIFEITQRMDQDIAQINPLGGHYVWLIKGKRFQWSFEPGLSGEKVNQQVYDDTKTAGVSGADKPYNYDVDIEGKKIFDYTPTHNDSVYGGY